MKVISFVASKGGVGKSTLAINCAVAAYQQNIKVRILDMDPQGSAIRWFERRITNNPDHGAENRLAQSAWIDVYSIDARSLEIAVAHAMDQAVDLLIIDTPGRDTPGISKAVNASNLVLIPSRPAFEDLHTVSTSVDMAKRLNKSFASILTQTSAMTAAKGGRVREALTSLLRLGSSAPQPIVNRIAYQDAHGLGLGVTEYEPGGKAATEINKLCDWITTTMKEHRK